MYNIVHDCFEQYAGAVLQSRALVDARDFAKPSARQILYCMHTEKFTHNKPFNKTLSVIGSCFKYYIHGDASCGSIIMRMSQPFCMRYPLVEVEGSFGTLMEPGSWGAPRYTAVRLSALADYLFKDIDKNTISEWQDNYDETRQYPMALPSKGFFNLVNGTLGIGTGAASSVPSFNLRELNEALIKVLDGCTAFDEIYCAPDFPTGGYLLNEEEVKESLKNGTGKSCRLRAAIDFDPKDRCLIVTEIPFGIYTNTICRELEEVEARDDNPGIDHHNDLTGTGLPTKTEIKIYLTKNANPDKVIKYLYKNTSLENYYSINLTMLEDGRFPKVYTWLELLTEHINHELTVYHRAFEFDLEKIENRILIINGLLLAIEHINEVISIIKESSSTKIAAARLIEAFDFVEPQVKAILDMKLGRLAKLESHKLEEEKEGLLVEAEHIQEILDSEFLLKKEVEKGLREVVDKFGDERRTRILNLKEENNEPIEIKKLLVNLTNKNNLYLNETSTLYTQKRGGTGMKFKVDKDEYVVDSIEAETVDELLFFTQKGDVYHHAVAAINVDEKVPVETLIEIAPYEKICAITTLNHNSTKDNIIFVTKKGYLKKSLLSEYNIKRQGSLKAIDLIDGDEIKSIIFANKANIGILTALGQFIICKTDDVRPIGRVARGVIGIKLNPDDYVVSARTIPQYTNEIVSISKNGYSKRTARSEFTVTGRNTKGVKIQKLKDSSDKMVDFYPIQNEKNVIISSTKSQIKIPISSIALLSKNAQGVIGIKLKNEESVVNLFAE